MTEFAHIEPVQSDKIFQIGRFHLAGVGDAWTTWDNIRDAVIDEVTIRGKAQQPAVVVRLIRGFLQRLPLPRLLHFLDLVLPQMVPVCSPAQAAGSRFPGSQLIRDLWLKRDEGAIVHEPEVNLMRLFASHAGIEHFRVEWNNKPLLLFADMEAKEYSSAWSYQNAKAVITTRQNVTMGLKKGNTVLLNCIFNTMASCTKLSCRCQVQCLAAKEVQIPTSCGSMSFLGQQTLPGFPKRLLKPSACRHYS